MAITSWGYFNEVIPGNITARLFTFATNHRFWTYNQDAVEVTPLSGGTREVQISIGEFGAFGIYNSNNSVATLQLPAPVSAGTQWYLISATHTWADEESETTFEALHCGSVAQRPAGYTVEPGTKITQPLAYVPISFGDATPGTPIDLRAMGTATGDVLVNSEHAISYLGYAGMSVWLGKTHYNRVLTASGNNHEWVINPGPFGRAAIAPQSGSFGGGRSGWATTGFTNRAIRDGNTVQIDVRIRRIGSSIVVGSGGGVADVAFMDVNPEWRPPQTVYGSCTYINESLSNSMGLVSLDSAGVIRFTAGTPDRNLRAMPSGSWSLSCTFVFIQTGV